MAPPLIMTMISRAAEYSSYERLNDSPKRYVVCLNSEHTADRKRERERKGAIDDARKNEIYDQAKHKYVALNKAMPLNFIGNAIHFVIFL